MAQRDEVGHGNEFPCGVCFVLVKQVILGIDDVDCDVPTGTSAALMEFSMGMWGWGVVEVRDELLI